MEDNQIQRNHNRSNLRIYSTDQMKAQDLNPYDKNPRIHGDGTILSKSILKHGDLSGVVFNTRNNMLVGGHYRTKTIPKDSIIEKEPVTDSTGTVAEGTIILPTGQRLHYREVDWDDIRHKDACITANNTTFQGEFDSELLDIQIKELSDELPDFDDFGFNLLAESLDIEIEEPESTGSAKGDGDLEGFDDDEEIPLFLNVTRSDFQKWKELKKAYSVKDDSEMLHELITETHEGIQ